MMVPSRYIECQLLGWYWAGYNGYDIAKWLFDSIVAVECSWRYRKNEELSS
jgi:hypothetical protein